MYVLESEGSSGGSCTEEDGTAAGVVLWFKMVLESGVRTYPPAAAPSRFKNVSGILNQGCSRKLSSGPQ